MKQFANLYMEILMVLEASWGCCQSIIDGLESRGACCEAICVFLNINIYGFQMFQGAAVNPFLMVSNIEDVAVKLFAYFYKETCMVLEVSRGCCESIMDGLESRGSCCQAIYKLVY